MLLLLPQRQFLLVQRSLRVRWMRGMFELLYDVTNETTKVFIPPFFPIMQTYRYVAANTPSILPSNMQFFITKLICLRKGQNQKCQKYFRLMWKASWGHARNFWRWRMIRRSCGLYQRMAVSTFICQLQPARVHYFTTSATFFLVLSRLH